MNKQPGMKPEEFVSTLKPVSCLSIPNVINIFSNAKKEDLPQIEAVGFHLEPEGATYVLEKYDYGDVIDSLDVAMEIRATDPDVHSPVQFVYYLGDVAAVKVGYCNSYYDGNSDTFYLACIDIVDRSLWLVVSPFGFHKSDYGERCPTKDVDTWRYICAKAYGRPSFDVMRLIFWDEFESIAPDQDSAPLRLIFSAQAVATTKRIEPRPFSASASTVMRVVREQLLEKAAELKRKMSASLAQ